MTSRHLTVRAPVDLVVVRYSVHMLSSEQCLRLSAQAKVLVMLLQIHWRPDRPVGYGVREAAEKIPCAFNTARKAFNELEEAGFIVMVDTSLFLSRTGSKARTWRLTWMPYGPVPNTKPPTNEWERKGLRKISTDSNMNAVKPFSRRFRASRVCRFESLLLVCHTRGFF